MSPRILLVTFALLVASSLVPLMPAAAQGVEGPLVARAETKAAQAGDDPAGFAGRQTSDEGLADDAEWTLAYGCYAGSVVADEAGLPPPDLERCRGFEEALGVEEDDEATEEAETAVAEAEPLRQHAVTEAEAIAEDVEATTARVVDSPTNALDEAAGLLDRTGRGIERIALAVQRFLDDTVTGLGLGLAAIGKGASIAVAAPVVGMLDVADAAAAFAATTMDGLGAALRWTGDRLTAAVAAGADSAAAGAASVTARVGAAFENVRDAIVGLLGGDGPAPDAPDRPAGDPLADAERTTDRLLRPVNGLVDDAMPR